MLRRLYFRWNNKHWKHNPPVKKQKVKHNPPVKKQSQAQPTRKKQQKVKHNPPVKKQKVNYIPSSSPKDSA